MPAILTIAEIYAQYADEWVLIVDPVTNPAHEVLSGNVVFHSKDRDEVYRQALILRPKHFAFVFTGSIPAGTAVVL